MFSYIVSIYPLALAVNYTIWTQKAFLSIDGHSNVFFLHIPSILVTPAFHNPQSQSNTIVLFFSFHIQFTQKSHNKEGKWFENDFIRINGSKEDVVVITTDFRPYPTISSHLGISLPWLMMILDIQYELCKSLIGLCFAEMNAWLQEWQPNRTEIWHDTWGDL